MYVKCELYSDNKPLALPVYTKLSRPTSPEDAMSLAWDEWIEFPYPVAELPLGAQVVLTVMDLAGPSSDTCLGGTTLYLFGKRGYVFRLIAALFGAATSAWHSRATCAATTAYRHIHLDAMLTMRTWFAWTRA